MPPSQRSSSVSPIAFKDFSPGISDLPGVSYPPEAATRSNTYRCIANQSGALVPLPRRTTPFAAPYVASGPTIPMAINGLYVTPIPLLPTVLPFQPDSYPEHELLVGVEWIDGGNRGQNLYRVRRYESPGDTYDLIRSHVPFADPAPTLTPNGMGFGTTRSNRADHYQPGCPIVVCMWTYGFNQNYLVAFPDDAAPGSTGLYTIFQNTTFLLNMACHQGRTVAQQATAYGHGSNTMTFMGENLLWSRVNDANSANWITNRRYVTDDVAAQNDPALVGTVIPPQVFVPENPSGLAFMSPMSANELFAVKTRGGFIATGDLDNPTVISYPMVTGSELSHTPVTTEIGVVYGNRSSGVWAWAHGDTSNLLSPRMIPDFWVISPGYDLDEFGGVAYQFARCDNWILTPNNFLFDTQLKSWWRLEDETLARFRYMTCLSHFIYGSESFYKGPNSHPISFWKREEKATSYSWQSQPIWESVADIVNVDTIELTAQGRGTITLTMTALDGDTRSISINLNDSGFPERFRENFAVQGKYLQLRIQADSISTTTPPAPAPTIYSVTLYPFTEAPIGHTL